MIFRAIFGIGLVALLAPHEPALGLGHPLAGLPTVAISWPSANMCNGSHRACAGHSGAKPDAASQRSLADVKNEIDASIKARAALAL